ncbi:MAG: hypothetical protein GX602_03390, partial [Dehalococcoidales bacterium]|nr:hypothetical protein [Dehalococcoidales bacterium]
MKKRLISLLILAITMVYGNLSFGDSLAMEMAAKAPENSIIVVAHGGYDSIEDELDATTIAQIVQSPQIKTFVDQVKALIQSQGVNLNIPAEPMAICQRIMENVEVSGIKLGGRVAGVVVDKFDPQAEVFDGCIYAIFDGGAARTSEISFLVESLLADFEISDKIPFTEPEIGKVGKVKQYSIEADPEVTFTMNMATKGNYSLVVFTMKGFEEKYLNLLADSSEKKSTGITTAFKGINIAGDDIIAILNTPEYLKVITNMIPAGQQEGVMVKNMFDKMGLNTMGPIYYRLGFSGKQFVLDCVATNYTSFANMVKPVNKSSLRAVPENATFMASVNYNIESIVSMYKEMILSMAGQNA